MGANTRVCRVCGKKYEGCKTPRIAGTNLNWREVACSYECGQEYLLRIMISRDQDNMPAPVVAPVANEEVFEEIHDEVNSVLEEEILDEEDFEESC